MTYYRPDQRLTLELFLADWLIDELPFWFIRIELLQVIFWVC